VQTKDQRVDDSRHGQARDQDEPEQTLEAFEPQWRLTCGPHDKSSDNRQTEVAGKLSENNDRRQISILKMVDHVKVCGNNGEQMRGPIARWREDQHGNEEGRGWPDDGDR
jgi:hypothetical protein